jgi:hypothetical protein
MESEWRFVVFLSLVAQGKVMLRQGNQLSAMTFPHQNTDESTLGMANCGRWASSSCLSRPLVCPMLCRSNSVFVFKRQLVSSPKRAVNRHLRFLQTRTTPLSQRLTLIRPSTNGALVFPRSRDQFNTSPVSPSTSRYLTTMAPATMLDRDILPDVVKPVNYDISIYDLELGGAFSYQGTVSILSRITKSTKEILLNSHQLKIHSAEVSLEHTKTQQSVKASDISYDAPRQRATLSFSEELPPSEKALIVIKFQGTMNNDMAGFYRSKYKPPVSPAASVPKDGEHHVMFSTQFESCDARRAFPCFDEPNLKASFDFEIEFPEDQVALSNMPEKSTRKSKVGFKVVSFERTPIMSTYLLTWAVGDFEYIEDYTKRKYNGKPIPVRVYTTRGLKSQAQYALDHAPQIIDVSMLKVSTSLWSNF